MQSNIHLNHGGIADASCTDSYTAINLSETYAAERQGDRVVAFVDADSALAIAKAAVEAYNHLTGGTLTLIEVVSGGEHDSVLAHFA